MSTRQRKPSLVKRLVLTVVLVGFQVYLGYNALSGQYGLEGRKELRVEITKLKAQSARLSAEIDSYNQRIALLDRKQLDPDMLSERALALLSMVHRDDRIVVGINN